MYTVQLQPSHDNNILTDTLKTIQIVSGTYLWGLNNLVYLSNLYHQNLEIKYLIHKTNIITEYIKQEFFLFPGVELAAYHKHLSGVQACTHRILYSHAPIRHNLGKRARCRRRRRDMSFTTAQDCFVPKVNKVLEPAADALADLMRAACFVTGAQASELAYADRAKLIISQQQRLNRYAARAPPAILKLLYILFHHKKEKKNYAYMCVRRQAACMCLCLMCESILLARLLTRV